MSMPLVLSFMSSSTPHPALSPEGRGKPAPPCPLPGARGKPAPPCSPGGEGELFSRGRAGTDLVVRTVAADLVTRCRLEAPGPDARGRGLDGLPRLGQIRYGRGVAAGKARFEEAQLHARRQLPRHLLLGERVDLELQALADAFVGGLLLRHIAGLVVHDNEPLGRLIHAINAATHAIGPQVEAELPLYVRRLLPRGFLLMVEARERGDAGALALLFMLAREEALVPPGIFERAQQVFEWWEVPDRPPAEVEFHGLVQRAAIDDRVVLAQGEAQDVDVVILERAGLVVVHLLVTDGQGLALRYGGEVRRLGLGRRRVALELLDGLGPERARGVLGQVEGLEDELAHLPPPLAAHVLGARHEHALLGARHGDIEQPPLLLLVEVARRERIFDERVGHLDGLPAARGRELVLDAVDEEYQRPLEALGLVH